MANKIVMDPAGKMLFQDPGKVLTQEEVVPPGPPICPFTVQIKEVAAASPYDWGIATDCGCGDLGGGPLGDWGGGLSEIAECDWRHFPVTQIVLDVASGGYQFLGTLTESGGVFTLSIVGDGASVACGTFWEGTRISSNSVGVYNKTSGCVDVATFEIEEP